MKSVKIVKDSENEIPVEILEQAIIDIAQGFKKLNASRLSERAIVLLVQDAVGATFATKGQVGAILKAAASLDKTYLKSKSV